MGAERQWFERAQCRHGIGNDGPSNVVYVEYIGKVLAVQLWIRDPHQKQIPSIEDEISDLSKFQQGCGAL